jgi:hypothetical protein
MRQHGRKSAASLAVVASMEVPRPAPPRSLSRAGKQVWRATTSRFQPEFFCGAEFLLEAYCDGVVTLRMLVELIKATDPADHKRLAVLVQLQKAQALLIGNLGGKLRLTPRSRFDRYAAAARPMPDLPKPWDLGRRPLRRDSDKPDDTGSPFPPFPAA